MSACVCYCVCDIFLESNLSSEFATLDNISNVVSRGESASVLPVYEVFICQDQTNSNKFLDFLLKAGERVTTVITQMP